MNQCSRRTTAGTTSHQRWMISRRLGPRWCVGPRSGGSVGRGAAGSARRCRGRCSRRDHRRGSVGAGGSLPLLAGIGATPHRWANAASERIRCGLSPTVVNSCPTTSTPTPSRSVIPGASVVMRPCSLLHQRLRMTMDIVGPDPENEAFPGQLAGSGGVLPATTDQKVLSTSCRPSLPRILPGFRHSPRHLRTLLSNG
jgi:hypothetical protein